MVRADGLPKPEIKWYCNDKLITNDDHYTINTTSDMQVTSKLIIKDFEEAHAGVVSLICKTYSYLNCCFFSIKQ